MVIVGADIHEHGQCYRFFLNGEMASNSILEMIGKIRNQDASFPFLSPLKVINPASCEL
jgi:hypothetical protein